MFAPNGEDDSRLGALGDCDQDRGWRVGLSRYLGQVADEERLG